MLLFLASAQREWARLEPRVASSNVEIIQILAESFVCMFGLHVGCLLHNCLLKSFATLVALNCLANVSLIGAPNSVPLVRGRHCKRSQW